MVRSAWDPTVTAIPYPSLPNPPLVEMLPAGTEFWRAYTNYGPISFNPGKGPPSRFGPMEVHGMTASTMYAGETKAAAISETVFHDVPVRGPARRVSQARLVGWYLHLLICTRDLQIARLRGPGLGRLGTTHGELVESPSSEYLYTAAWGEAVLESTKGLDGLSWTSRQDSTAAAFLFVDVGDALDAYAPLGGPQRLDAGAGRWLVDRLASDAGILISKSP
jgi:hypothetical protein